MCNSKHLAEILLESAKELIKEEDMIDNTPSEGTDIDEHKKFMEAFRKNVEPLVQKYIDKCPPNEYSFNFLINRLNHLIRLVEHEKKSYESQ